MKQVVMFINETEINFSPEEREALGYYPAEVAFSSLDKYDRTDIGLIKTVEELNSFNTKNEISGNSKIIDIPDEHDYAVISTCHESGSVSEIVVHGKDLKIYSSAYSSMLFLDTNMKNPISFVDEDNTYEVKK